MNIIKMYILSKMIYRFNEIPIKILMTFLPELEKHYHKLNGASKDPDSEAIFSKKKNTGSTILSEFKILIQGCSN